MPARLSPERELELRERTTTGSLPVVQLRLDDLRALLGELDYLRGQVEAETAYASELRRRLLAGPVPELEKESDDEHAARTRAVPGA